MKKSLSLILALVMLIGLVPLNVFAESRENTVSGQSAFAGKTISILGDSISTYAGVSNDGSINTTLSGSAVYYGTGSMNRSDTWWQQTVDVLGMELLVNNSWSGSCVLHTRSNTVGAYVDRCVQLHNNQGDEPDVIVVFMGTNDFSYYQSTLGIANIDYDALITDNGDGAFTYATPTTTCEAYAIMLHKMTVRYPDAEIYCMTMTARRDPDKVDSYADVGQPTAFNAELVQVITRFGGIVVDLENCGIDKAAEIFDQYMGDGRVHPNAAGMDMITKALLCAMLGREVTLYNVSGAYTGVDTDNAAAIAASGMGYTAKLTLAAGYSDLKVSVTMGGVDITETAYADGTIRIEAVTGDIVITATAKREPLNFRWEYENGELVSEENPLTRLAGSTTDGVFADTRYRLQITVLLQHDCPWVLEWKGSGTGGFMLSEASDASSAPFFFRRAGNYLNAFGDHDGSRYNNYGVALDTKDIDGSTLHVYRLENRIAADGTNMVYLYVDGVEIGPLNNHYVGGSAQGTTGDWISGKDFKINYIGTPSHPLTNYSMEYLLVNECSHSYQGGKCTICGEEHPNLANLEGKVISILGDSISTFAGYIPVADGFNREHLARYPQDNLLTDVNETWWMQVIAALDAKLGINDSWRGATLSGGHPVTTGDTGENAAMSNLTRIQNLGSNGTPDVILLYGGTNDLAHVSKVGTFDPNTAPTAVDLTTTKWDNLADGFVHTLLRIRHYYPDAVIVAMLPTYTASYYSDEKLAQGNAVMAAICQHYGVAYVDLRYCGISTDDLPDGIHPDAAGMDHITQAVMDALLNQCETEAGENIVHSVIHELTAVVSSLGYYKGVSNGRPFVATLTGEDMVVTVTMGGVDVTDSVYAGSVINIPSVTGDIVITATGRVKPIYEDYLQPLPETLCAGTNLWTALEHNAAYYTVSGWGIHSSGTVYSVTIPVSAGDRIYATSFGAAGENGASMNGIRATWFGADGVLVSMSANETYAEFSANGYLTAPEGAVAVNIPMWNNSDDNELYILGRDHSYENGTCTACGQEEPKPYAGKTIACVGDSITCGVGVTRDETDYVTLLAQSLEMDYIRLGVSGTTLCTDGHATCNIGKLTEENLAGADVVTILMGINDFVQARKGYYTLGSIDSTDTSTIYGAVHMWCQRIEELRQTDSLKNTEFYFLTPVITSWNNSVSSTRNWDQSKTNIHGYTLRDLCNAIVEVCALYDIPVIDLNLVSGLYYNSADDNTIAEFGGDGAHPGAVGHQMMAEAIKHALMKDNLRDDHDHNYGSWITTTYPDCDGGEQQRVCSVCTATERKPLDGMGHTYENDICTGCGREKPVTVTTYGDIQYSVDGRIVTVTHSAACVVGYWDETAERYIAIAATANADGSYSFDAAGEESVALLVIGDVNGDGQLTMADKTLLDQHIAHGAAIDEIQQFAADVNGNGAINSADRILLARALMSVTSPIYKPFVW